MCCMRAKNWVFKYNLYEGQAAYQASRLTEKRKLTEKHKMKETYLTLKNIRDCWANFVNLHANIFMIIAVVKSSMLSVYQMANIF
jgi:hypothetical protein